MLHFLFCGFCQPANFFVTADISQNRPLHYHSVEQQYILSISDAFTVTVRLKVTGNCSQLSTRNIPEPGLSVYTTTFMAT